MTTTSSAKVKPSESPQPQRRLFAYFSATMTDFAALPGVYRALFLYIEPGIYSFKYTYPF